jgi:hypothetical protein
MTATLMRTATGWEPSAFMAATDLGVALGPALGSLDAWAREWSAALRGTYAAPTAKPPAVMSPVPSGSGRPAAS